MPVAARSDEHGSRLHPFPGVRPPRRGQWTAKAHQPQTALVTAAKVSNARMRGTQFSSCNPILPFRMIANPACLVRYLRHKAAIAALKVGIGKQIAWHTFRHTYTTLLHANGEDVKVVQELLRHGSAKITLDVYAQAVTKAKRTAQNRVVACLRTRKDGLLEHLCPQSVPTPELANDSKLLKRFGVPDGI